MGDPVARDFDAKVKEYGRTKKVPDMFSHRIWASTATPCIWYDRLWNEMKLKSTVLPKRTDVSKFIYETLKGYDKQHMEDLQEFTKLHGLTPLTNNFNVALLDERMENLPEFQFYSYVDFRNVLDGDGFITYAPISDLSLVDEEIVDSFILYKSRKKRYDGMNPNTRTAHGVKDSMLKLSKEITKHSNDVYMILDGLDGPYLAGSHSIRLKGIDAPEMDQEYGKDAKATLRRVIGNKRVMVSGYKVDPYQRWVSNVYLGRQLVQEELIKRGAAWHYPRYDNREKFAQLHAAAREGKVGLWQYPDPEAPWEFKRRKREKEMREKEKMEKDKRDEEKRKGGGGPGN